MTITAPHYLLRDENGDHWIFIERQRQNWNGRPPTALGITDAGGNMQTLARQCTVPRRSNWWNVGDVVPNWMRFDVSPGSRITGYRLPEGIEFAGLSNHMTPAEWQHAQDEADEDVRARLRLYEAEREEIPQDPILIDVSNRVLLEEPVEILDLPVTRRKDNSVVKEVPAADQPQWVASLPIELREHPEYQWLFPGRLTGFCKWFAGEAELLPGVKAAYGFKTNECSIHPHQGERTEWKRHGLDSVPGRNLADALVNWQNRAIEMCAEAGVFRMVCPTCEGHGYVEHDS